MIRITFIRKLRVIRAVLRMPRRRIECKLHEHGERAAAGDAPTGVWLIGGAVGGRHAAARVA